jgi:catechol 2,3-dioxygenase-like lactoylglutathione lyase family enzyme
MPAQSLNHFTILARDLEATKDFYTDIVGLTVGDRPPLALRAIGFIAAACRRCT